jgi:hypothetical protein
MARVPVTVTNLTPPKATLTTALSGTNNDLVYTARYGGPGGNNIRVEYVVAGTNTALSVVVTGFDITVNVATDGAGAATSTAAQVKTAVEGNANAAKLVTVANASGNDGTGVVTALSITALSGGALQITPPAQVNGDATNGHYITGNDGLVVLEVVSSDAGAQTVSIEYGPGVQQLADIPAQVESIPAGAIRWLGPFANGAFDQTENRDLYFTPSVSTTLKFRAYKMVKAI